MKGLTIRFIEPKGLIVKTGQGYEFTKGFTKQQMESNTFYYNPQEDTLIQVNTDYNQVNVLRNTIVTIPNKKISKEGYLELIKNVALSKGDFYLESLEDECAEYLNDMGLSKLGDRNHKEYVEELTNEFDGIFDDLYAVRVFSDTEPTIYFYRGGTITYAPYGKALPTKEEYLGVLTHLSQYTEMLNGLENLEHVMMNEKEITNHPLSELHVITEYLKKTNYKLPKEVKDALGNGLEQELEKMSQSYKGKQIYKVPQG